MWKTLVSAATIGTNRQPLILPKVKNDHLDRLLTQIDTTDPAKSLLSAAALLSLTQTAGRVPVIPDFEEVSPSSPEDLPVCRQEAAHSLKQMLAGEFPEVLPEWFARVTALRWRVPPECLPDLLDWGNRNPQWKWQLLPLLGSRGRWLAAQNPEWQYAEASIDPSIWETGTSAMRLWVLQLLRSHDPALARDWVSSTWKQDKAPDRAAFLATFKTGLSLADESLLESVLDDKSKQVRTIAADLLARLPDSQLTQRARARIASVIHIVTKIKLRLEVTLPQTCADAAIRDGIVPQAPSGIGEKAWWVLQMLGQVPPSFWTAIPGEYFQSQKLGVGAKPVGDNLETNPKTDNPTALPSGDLIASPGKLLQVAASSEWYAVLVEGWAIAAERHQNVEWAEALLNVLPAFPGTGNNLSELSQNLMEILPIDRRESLVYQVLQEDTGDRLRKNHPLLFLLKLCRHLWSRELSLAVLNRVAMEISTSQDNYNWGVRSTIKDCAYFLHPTVVADADQILKNAVKPDSYWAQTVDDFLEILQFRYKMLMGI